MIVLKDLGQMSPKRVQSCRDCLEQFKVLKTELFLSFKGIGTNIESPQWFPIIPSLSNMRTPSHLIGFEDFVGGNEGGK